MSFLSKHHPNHNHQNSVKANRLLIASALNILITLVEIIGGILSQSIALLSDAVHNLGDTFAIILAYFANLIGHRDATEKKTFGYKRIEILTAFLNALILIVITIFLFIAAYNRLLNPKPVKGLVMFVVASTGLLANLTAVFILKNQSRVNINVRAAYLHLLGDTISSLAVIIGSLFIYFFEVFWIDPLISVLIGIYILKEAYSVIKETIDILMQSTPPSLNLSAIAVELENHAEIDNIHHVHAWKLDDKQIHFECHIDLVKNLTVSETDDIRSEIEKILKNKFGISHVTIQFEYNCCEEKGIIHPRLKH